VSLVEVLPSAAAASLAAPQALVIRAPAPAAPMDLAVERWVLVGGDSEQQKGWFQIESKVR
jgi:hypothetical protein